MDQKAIEAARRGYQEQLRQRDAAKARAKRIAAKKSDQLFERVGLAMSEIKVDPNMPIDTLNCLLKFVLKGK